MAEIRPLYGVRFDRTRVGEIGPLLAPPYDVAPVLENPGRFSISDIENVDLGLAGDQHALAAQRYRGWLDTGILRREGMPALYVHRHTFMSDGEATTRTGIIARVRLEDWSKRIVLPHEGTHPGPRAERLARLHSVNANLSPLYFLCRDPRGEYRALLEDAVSGLDIDEERDRMGGGHRLAPISDPVFHRTMLEFFETRTLFVADGHHRYEAALAYCDEQRAVFQNRKGPWDYVLALIAAVEDPGVIVRPTHRLVVGVPMDVRPLWTLLSRWFLVEEGDGGASDDQGTLFRVVVAESPRPWIVRARPGNPHLALLPKERGAAWRSLEISAVEGVVQSLFGGGEAAEHQVLPIVNTQTAVAEVRAGKAAAAFLLPAPPLDRLFAVAEEGDLLPPKSTWFEPKAPAGLVINDLALSAVE